MTLATRMTLILTLTLALGSSLPAQETSTSTPAAATATSANEAAEPQTPARSSQETRNEFSSLLNQHPSELATILALDPSLLSNDAFLAGYPQLAKFVAAYPEVRRNPRYFLGNYESRRSDSVFADFLQGLFVFGVFAFIAFFLAWLVRTIIEQKKWSRISRTQTEVHTKLLDRFGTSTELLEYMKTPAGTKFLESAPIPLHETQASPTAPISRVLWSIQLGIVVAAGAIGLLLVSGRFEKETSQGLYGMGVVALCIGAGFVASAVISLFVSRRMGLWHGPDAAELNDSGTVR